MKKRFFAAVLAAALLLSFHAFGDNASLPAPAFKEVSVHDPSVIRVPDGTFYIYGSHMTAARSTDLISWKMFSRNGPQRAFGWWKKASGGEIYIPELSSESSCK